MAEHREGHSRLARSRLADQPEDLARIDTRTRLAHVPGPVSASADLELTSQRAGEVAPPVHGVERPRGPLRRHTCRSVGLLVLDADLGEHDLRPALHADRDARRPRR